MQADEKVLVVADRSRDLLDAAPLAYQRVVAQSHLGRDRVLAAGLLQSDEPAKLSEYAREAGVAYLVVFENFEPWLVPDIFFANLPRTEPDRVDLILRLETAAIYRVFLHSRETGP